MAKNKRKWADKEMGKHTLKIFDHTSNKINAN